MAKLGGADLSDANLDHAEGLTQAQLERAHWNSGTKLPAGLIGMKMPKDEHIAMLGRSAAAWNAWRAEHGETPDLSQAALRGLDLSGFDLSRADLRQADLRGTNLSQANLFRAHLDGANFFKAVLDGANLAGAFLTGAQFLNCAQLVVTGNWQSAFRDDALACGAPIPDRNLSE